MKKLSICMLLLIFSIGAMEKKVDGKEDVPATSQEVQPDTCPICLCDIEASEAILTCKELCKDGDPRHVFHKDCLTRQLTAGIGVYGCPVCRKPLKDELQKKYERVDSRPVDPGLDLPTLLAIFAAEGREVRELSPGIILVRPAHDELERDESYRHQDPFARVLAESRREAEARDLAERRRAADRRFARGFFGLGGHSEREAEECDFEAALEESSHSVAARNDLSEGGRTEEVSLAALRDAERRFARGFVRGSSSNRNSEEPSIRPVDRGGYEDAHESFPSVLSRMYALAERERALARLRELGELIELRRRLDELMSRDQAPASHRDRDHEDDHDLPRCPIS